MTMRRVLLLSIGLLAPIVTIAESDQKENADYKPVKMVGTLETAIPAELKQLGMTNPRVAFHVIVGAEGEMIDFLAVEATHVGLLPKAEEELSMARFKPATLDGVATTGAITVTVTFFDPEQRAWKQGFTGAPMVSTVSDAVERKLYASHPETFTLRESKPNELDEPITLVEAKIYRLHEPDKAPPTGQVLVEYYIDHNGRVRLPEIIKSDDIYLSRSAIMSLHETRFAAPTRNGRPTYVRVRQPFNFD